MNDLALIASACGYRIIEDSSDVCMEITGNGDWNRLSREAYRILDALGNDHASIILRDPLGGRTLVDLGNQGERRHALPPAAFLKDDPPDEPHYHYIGVKLYRGKWIAVVASHYIGSFASAEEAAHARDAAALRYHAQGVYGRQRLVLNFPTTQHE